MHVARPKAPTLTFQESRTLVRSLAREQQQQQAAAEEEQQAAAAQGWGRVGFPI